MVFKLQTSPSVSWFKAFMLFFFISLITQLSWLSSLQVSHYRGDLLLVLSYHHSISLEQTDHSSPNRLYPEYDSRLGFTSQTFATHFSNNNLTYKWITMVAYHPKGFLSCLSVFNFPMCFVSIRPPGTGTSQHWLSLSSLTCNPGSRCQTVPPNHHSNTYSTLCLKDLVTLFASRQFSSSGSAS